MLGSADIIRHERRRMTGTVTALAAGGSAALTALAAAFWWIYRRGKASGRSEAKLEALGRAQLKTGEVLENIAARVAQLESRHNRASLIHFRSWRKA
jgi:hypothetical protein